MNIAEARNLYFRYETELKEINDRLEIHKPPYWWENSKDAVFLAIYKSKKIIGFVIVGYGSFIDSDVCSEICEIYLDREERNFTNFNNLLNKAYRYLKSPWGFQVLVSNDRANLLFEQYLKKSAIEYTKNLGKDGATKVYKYRVINSNT